jgi:hypothetical protein
MIVFHPGLLIDAQTEASLHWSMQKSLSTCNVSGLGRQYTHDYNWLSSIRLKRLFMENHAVRAGGGATRTHHPPRKHRPSTNLSHKSPANIDVVKEIDLLVERMCKSSNEQKAIALKHVQTEVNKRILLLSTDSPSVVNDHEFSETAWRVKYARSDAVITSREVSTLLSLASAAVPPKHAQKGRLFGLLPPGKSTGMLFPKWQFTAGVHERLPELLISLNQYGRDNWAIAQFVEMPNGSLYGLCPSEVLLGKLNVQRDVSAAAKSLLATSVGDRVEAVKMAADELPL